jgi:membrane protease YdiL (CAAX protease family)
MTGAASAASRKDRVKAIIIGFIGFMLMAVAAAAPAIILAVMVSTSLDGNAGFAVQPSGGVTMTDRFLSVSTVLTILLTPVLTALVLLFPPVRRAVRGNGGLGLWIHDLRSRLHVDAEWKAWAKTVAIGLGTAALVFGALQVMGMIAELVSPGSATSNDTTQDIVDGIRSGPLAIKIALIMFSGVIGPLVEELVFRGVIAKSWTAMASTRTGRIISYVGSGLLFATAHFLSSGFSLSVEVILTILVTWILGTVLAWYAHRWSSLWPGVITHVTYNTGSLLLAVL